jgi:23S rRNA (uracil1939-C5)-methyltransferase
VGKLADGRTVFVPRTAPGDLVELADVRIAKRFARARLQTVLQPSADRVPPRCPHYTADECGGCQLQHLSYPAQLEARRGFVGDALRRIARLDVTDPAIEPAAYEFGYRTRMTLAARGGCIGLHRLGGAGAVFDLEECPITADSLNALWRQLSAARALLPPGLAQLVLRLDPASRCHVIARVRVGQVWTRADELARRLAEAGTPAVLWWEPEGGVPRVVAGRPGSFAPAGVFEQAHPVMAERARAFAVERLGPVEGLEVWDLYAGIGETTTQLARRGARVSSVELDRRAVAYAERSESPASRRTGAVETLAATLPAPDRVVTNPPRTGMDAGVTALIARRRPERVAYISCDPATLARDVVRLGTGYRLNDVRCFDFFPQTAHIETVAILERT